MEHSRGEESEKGGEEGRSEEGEAQVAFASVAP
jgi:hypothetical protein